MHWLPVLKNNNSQIYVPTNGFFSLSNSPYPMHGDGKSIDIYLGARTFDHVTALSPVSGTVVLIKKVRTPKRVFCEDNIDYILVIQDERKESFFRILHVKPKIKVNDKISVGDELGELIRSGFFCPWTDPHMHVEIRNNLERIATPHGCLDLDLISKEKSIKPNNGHNVKPIRKIEGIIHFIRDEYFLVNVNLQYIVQFGSFFGFSARVINQIGILDAGIPYYPHGGIIYPTGRHVFNNSKVSIFDTNVGIVNKIKKNYLVFKTLPFEPRLKIDGKTYPLHGISASIHFSSRCFKLKVIPKHKHTISELQLKKNVVIELHHTSKKINTC